MGRFTWISLVVLIGLAPPGAQAGSHSVLALRGHHGYGNGGYGPGPRNFGGGGYGYGGYGYGGYGYGIPYYYGVPYVVGGYGPGYGFGGQLAPIPVAAFNPVAMRSAAMTPTQGGTATTARTKRPDTGFAAETMTLGDRLFRAGNLTKAVERYEQSIKADPSKAAARVKLAQVAMVRGQYHDAANWLREADTVEPTYLIKRRRHPRLYLEPGDFTRQLGKLESHLQSHPEDRDAWLLLGAEHYLSGRTRQAGDIFLRLTDRQADPTLSAFLSATKARDEP